MLRIEVDDAGKVAWVAHIHSVGKRLNGSFGIVLSALQVVEEHIVGVVGCYEPLDRHSHGMSEKCGTDVSEVARWHTDDATVGFSFALQLGDSVEIIEGLWQESCHVDTVGACQFHVLVQFGVHESVLHESLTIIEHAIDLNGCDVLAERGELAFLNLADFPFGIEHIDVNSVHSKKSIGDSRPCVSRCCHEHVHLFCSFLFDEVLKQASHETRAYIFESQRRAVKEFKAVDVFLELHNRCLECQCVVDNLFQGIGIYIFAKECIGYGVGYFLERQVLHVVKKIGRQLLDALRHVESAVFCQTFDYSFMKVGYGCLVVG